MKKLLFALLPIIVWINASAQEFMGTITNKNEAVPFANVYYEGSTIGTSSNLSGDFTLEKKTEFDKITITAVGFEKKTISTSDFKVGERLQIELASQSISLKAVEVSNKRRDPAYYIMKKVIKKRKFHAEQVQAYTAEVYMKSSIHVTEIPDYIKALADSSEIPDSSELGLMFLSESVNKLSYEAPNNIQEEMIASKVSGSQMVGNNFSWNRARDVLLSFYDNKLNFTGDRELISPLSSSALAYYDFKYEGEFYENKQTINKIKVTPKRKIDPCFTGYIYIVDDLFCLHSVDLMVAKSVSIEYTDSIFIKQSFQKLDSNLYLPISVNLDWHYTILGIKAQYYALGQLSKYDLGKEETVNSKNEVKKDKNLLFSVNQEAQDKNDEYWVDNRPVELTEDETENYHKGDSINALINSPEYLDSLDRIANKLTFGKLFLSGYQYRNRKDSITWSIPSLLYLFQYTSVDGAVVEIDPMREKRFEHGYRRIAPKMRYGFASGRFDASLLYQEQFNEINREQVSFEAGIYTEQINRTEPIGRDLNSYYNLFASKNFAQYYRSVFFRAAYNREIHNGVTWYVAGDYADRFNLDNSTNYSFKENPNIQFTPNRPAYLNKKHRLLLKTAFKLQPGNKYEMYPGEKRNLGSKWPEIFVGAQYSPDYFTKLWTSAEKTLSLGLVGKLNLYGKAGKFFENRNVELVDAEHFTGNQTIFAHSSSSSFNLLPYYNYSSTNEFIHLQAKHSFNGFIMNKLPLLRKTSMVSFAAIRYLNSDGNEFVEIAYGLDRIFKIVKAEVVSSYVNNKLSAPSLRIGLSIAQ